MSANQQTRNRKNQKPRSNFRRLMRRFMSSLLRSLFLLAKPKKIGQSGFVLPTTVLLLLVVSLTAGALSFRTFNRTQSAFLAREQQVIDNVAAPAIDRAKAKLEYLFSSDNRLPGTGTPSSDVLSGLVNPFTPNLADLGITALGTDPYTLPDETRLDINGDDVEDNAWSFSFDLNGDGVEQEGEVIAYSLLMDDAVDTAGTLGDRSDDIKLEDTGSTANELKADSLVTRNGPINTDETLSACGGSREPQQGWLVVNAAELEKNFQITAFVSNGKSPGRANSAMELQQVRRALKGNRWGAWFKYDMEIYPGPEFNWNGAIHSDANIILTDDFRAHMVSSHNSCLYSEESSRFTMAEKNNDNDPDNIIDVDAGDFQGQLVLGAPAKATYGQEGDMTDIHIYVNNTEKPKLEVADTKLTASNDSVTNKSGRSLDTPIEIAVDPVALFTQNISRHRTTTNWKRADDWEDQKYFTGGRVLNDNVRSPYLDDFYRADNRYGPRPTYDTTDWVGDSDDGTDRSASSFRSSADYDKSLGEDIASTDPNADNLVNENSGLDGYWERQSITNGMRVVVGQRVELGDSNGWNFDPITSSVVDNADALYPPDSNLGSNNGSDNKQKQRVTLRDNLAAVQGMVVYHYETNAGEYPLACMASTAHPGTWATLNDSRTFNTYTSTGAIKADFLNGEGTNGWEFAFPTAFDTEAEFSTAIGSTQPLGKALRNLAYFAGDPKGGAPSFTPVQEANGSTIVHPFPHQAMWGDFSILRRIFEEYLDNGTTYENLSFADKSALHSAACTLGLLAYNLEQEEAVISAVLGDSTINWSNLGTKISNISSKNQLNNGNPMIGRPADGTNLCKSLDSTTPNYADPNWTGCPSQNPYSVTDTTDPQHTINYFSQFTSEEWINALVNDGSLDVDEKNALEIMLTGNQILRDRTLGFSKFGTVSADLSGNFDPSTGTWTNPNGSAGVTTGAISSGDQFTLSCDPEYFNQGAVGASSNSKRAKLALAFVFCSYNTPAKYPALYYLFPVEDHDHDGDGNHAQPGTEEYISEVSTYGVNGSVQYKALSDADITAIAFAPKAATIVSNTLSTWSLPNVTTASAATLDPESMDIKLPDGKLASLSLIDKGMYNGREEMAVRVLDIDLGKLTRDKNSSDYWISDEKDTVSGILYAAREDAKREDSIVRPAVDTWANCDTLTELVSSTCYTNTGSATPEDPPLSRRDDGTFVGISLKPVNFAPDPDRRPYGFRLNADLDGNNGDLSDRLNREWGFTFVTDNAAYIKGEFNPHTTNGTDTIEEFTETLLDDTVDYGTDFYDERNTLNTSQFATDTVDRWRVAEVLADSVSILSSRFVDGSVEEGFIRSRTEVSSEFKNEANAFSRTSFHNQQRPLSDGDRFGHAGKWLRINGVYPTRDDSSWVRDGSNGGPSYDVPIWVGRNGESLMRDTNSGTVFYRRFDDAEGDSAPASNTATSEQTISGNDFVLPAQRNDDTLINVPPALAPRVNATIISGLVPSRRGQGYGGLHNFPRFLERWEQDDDKTPLYIQGAFLQLNFSTASTGPFDADSWDPGDSTNDNDQYIDYYDPPERRWGYDVALQYSPAGPIAQRFVTIEKPRSEHYREIPIEDPYVTNLRCAREKDDSDNWVRKFATEDCS